MLLTYKVKLLPDEEQKAALLETMERFNQAVHHWHIDGHDTKGLGLAQSGLQATEL